MGARHRDLMSEHALTRWYVCARYDYENEQVIRDFVRCATLQDALNTLMPGHIEEGWRVWEETNAPRKGLTVLSVWMPVANFVGDGAWEFEISAKKLFP